MRKQQYVAAVACLVAGLIGFVGVYATDKGRERKEAKEQAVEETQKAPASYEVKSDTTVEDATKRAQEQAKKLAEQRARKEKEELQECIMELGVPANIRGEALSLEQFAKLSNIIYDRQQERNSSQRTE